MHQQIKTPPRRVVFLFLFVCYVFFFAQFFEHRRDMKKCSAIIAVTRLRYFPHWFPSDHRRDIPCFRFEYDTADQAVAAAFEFLGFNSKRHSDSYILNKIQNLLYHKRTQHTSLAYAGNDNVVFVSLCELHFLFDVE